MIIIVSLAELAVSEDYMFVSHGFLPVQSVLKKRTRVLFDAETKKESFRVQCSSPLSVCSGFILGSKVSSNHLNT